MPTLLCRRCSNSDTEPNANRDVEIFSGMAPEGAIPETPSLRSEEVPY